MGCNFLPIIVAQPLAVNCALINDLKNSVGRPSQLYLLYNFFA